MQNEVWSTGSCFVASEENGTGVNGHPCLCLDISIVCTLQPQQRAQGQDPQGKRLSEAAVAEKLRVE